MKRTSLNQPSLPAFEQCTHADPQETIRPNVLCKSVRLDVLSKGREAEKRRGKMNKKRNTAGQQTIPAMEGQSVIIRG